MNSKKAKALRKKAKLALYEWYKTIIEDSSELTPEKAVQYTPKVKYFKKQDDQTVYVSQYTMRWFIKQEKKVDGTGRTIITTD